MPVVNVVVGDILDRKCPIAITMLGWGNKQAADHKVLLEKCPTAFRDLERIDANTLLSSACIPVICETKEEGDYKKFLMVRPQFLSEDEPGKIDPFLRGYSVHTVMALSYALRESYGEIAVLGGDSLRGSEGMERDDYLEVAHGIVHFISSNSEQAKCQMSICLVVSNRLPNSTEIGDECIHILKERGCEVVDPEVVIASIGYKEDTLLKNAS